MIVLGKDDVRGRSCRSVVARASRISAGADRARPARDEAVGLARAIDLAVVRTLDRRR